MSLSEACRKEVIELHQFFDDWGNGRLSDSDESFARFSSAVADDFEIVSPEGGITSRKELVAGLRGRNGAQRDRGYRIWIENERCRSLSAELQLVVYEEWQEVDQRVRGRVSTALMRQKTEAPNGIEWLHVHETWLPETSRER